MIPDEDLPPVSVIVPVHGNKPYLGPAIDSILALDYPDLEIVIQDDASPDDTFEVLKAIVAAYAGPHRVSLGRNDTNMSMATYNVLMDRAKSRYIVVAHDDDLQRPDRVRRLMEVYLTHRVSMVASSMTNIDVDGARLGISEKGFVAGRVAIEVMARQGRYYANGAALSWDREIFDVFGPLDIDGTARTSDWVPPFRAALLEGVYLLDDDLVYRRMHPDRRYLIGKVGETADARAVDAASESITQIAYRLKTLDEFEARLPNDKGFDIPALRSLLLESLRDRADQLALHRNRLHMANRRMTWIPRLSVQEAVRRDRVKRSLSNVARRLRRWVRRRG